MIYLLNDQISFPDPREGEKDGLFAVGGDLSPNRLLLAYSNGIFPWYAFRKEDANPYLLDDNGKPYIQWWCPMQRFVIFPKEIHISHSMRQLIKQNKFTVTIDHDFENVIRNCSNLRIDQRGAWLGGEMIEAYTKLHELGFAHSVEVWDENKNLVGGLYGINIGKFFFGESMFSLVANASKMALITFAKIFDKSGGVFIDCQFETPHLKSMGGRYITYDDYMMYIRNHK